VAALFLLNAVAFANVVPRLPAIKADLGLSNTSLGTAVAAMAVGALLSGPFAGRWVARFTSARVAVACSVGMGAVMPGFALAPSWPALAGTFLLLGALDSVMDVSMNAHALRVQRAYARSIISALHGLWSVGAVLGGGLGALAAALDVPLRAHLGVAGGAVALSAVAIRRGLLTGPDEPEAAAVAEERRPSRSRGTARRRLALLGLVVVMAAAIEDSPQSWGAVLLHDELGTSVAVGGLAYLAFQSAMTAGRLLADRLVDRLGAVQVVRAGAVITGLAMASGLAIGQPWAVVMGFGLAGLGTAPLFPLVFHAAGEVPGVTTGHGVAAVAWTARIGFLVAAPLVGALSDATSLRLGLVTVPAAALVVVVMAGALGPREPTGGPMTEVR
jgi:MFS family permease